MFDHSQNRSGPLIRGLYLITESPGRRPEAAWFDIIEAALASGVSVLQFRDKSENRETRRRLAAALRDLCGDYGVSFIVNDDIELALETSADGVHLGRDDCGIAEARGRLGARALIGVSCYDDLARAEDAEAKGADYVAFGRFFPSRTKPVAPGAGTDVLQRARQALTIPRVAIGGIDLTNASSVIEAGADAVAVIGAVFDSPDPAATVRRFLALFGG
ncbi:MAG: thiamine phosphate synthase [Gammaproteobacteria bacterium]|nr:thiamine phosphate synthase [Gammaproteobacteria bacterium]